MGSGDWRVSALYPTGGAVQEALCSHGGRGQRGSELVVRTGSLSGGLREACGLKPFRLILVKLLFGKHWKTNLPINTMGRFNNYETTFSVRDGNI